MKKSQRIGAATMGTEAPVMEGPLSTTKIGSSLQSSSDESIRPFQVKIPQEELDDLKRRILATHWPERETVNDQSQGVQLATMQALASYWANNYDWRKVETKLNSMPQFITNIDGLDIYFIHVRSKHKNAMPVIITHGWPGSIIEQLKIIGPLTDPTGYGGKAEDAFDVVVPSIPGFGFSGKPTSTGWDPGRIARAWPMLMKRLGYNKFAAQGGDWGGIITEIMASQAPPGLIGIHTNLPGTVPVDVSKAITSNGPAPAGLSDEEKHAFEKLQSFFARSVHYAYEMANRPQTFYGIADSPVGLAAWLIDHPGDGNGQPAAAIAEAMRKTASGNSETELTRDDLLDNITLYWLTNTVVSAARLYWENKFPFFEPKNISIPVAVSAFPSELYQAPRSWAEKAYSKLIYYNKPARGGHFGAWEQPQIFVDEVRAGLKSLR